MGNTPCKRADSLHLLRLAKLVFKTMSLGNITSHSKSAYDLSILVPVY